MMVKNNLNNREWLRAEISARWPTPSTQIYQRIEIPIALCNIPDWLAHQAHDTKMYWQNRSDNFETGGIGIAKQVYDLSALKDLNPDYPQQRFYGGRRFDPGRKSDAIWQPFGNTRFILPLFEIYRDETGSHFCCNLTPDMQKTDLLKAFDNLGIATPQKNMPSILPSLPPHRISQTRWMDQVNDIRQAIKDGVLKKLVLARDMTQIRPPHIDTWQIIKQLKCKNANTYLFCFQIVPDSVFIGASPERLYYRLGQTIETEAVAGTRTRGKTEVEDQVLGDELLNAPKDRHEHRLVVQYILQILYSLCQETQLDTNLHLLKQNHVQHLCQKLKGTLKPNIKDDDILAALHPTPAVGGLPVEIALKWIRELEPFDRGWYAGPIGWLNAKSAEFAVGIRSILLEENRIHLYSGAGIVADSDPAAEWQEIGNKIATYRNLLRD